MFPAPTNSNRTLENITIGFSLKYHPTRLKQTMKCVSFNVNSVRMRFHQLESVIERHQPTFIGLQETKVTDDEFPLAELQKMGYNVEFFGQKTHYGVALLAKLPFKTVFKGFKSDTDDAQRRFIGGEFILPNGESIYVFNGYFPQGEAQDHPVKYPNKRRYYADLQSFLQTTFSPEQNLVVMGDMNISPADIDIGIGEDNRKRWLKAGKCSFLPEERQWLDTLMDWGLVDTYRKIFPDDNSRFSWFDYRSKGFDREPKRGLRIDLILASRSLAARCQDSGIDYDIRAMDKPSDHCPIWSSFAL